MKVRNATAESSVDAFHREACELMEQIEAYRERLREEGIALPRPDAEHAAFLKYLFAADLSNEEKLDALRQRAAAKPLSAEELSVMRGKALFDRAEIAEAALEHDRRKRWRDTTKANEGKARNAAARHAQYRPEVVRLTKLGRTRDAIASELTISARDVDRLRKEARERGELA